MFKRFGGNEAPAGLESILLILIGDSMRRDDCDIFVERKKKSHISLNITGAIARFSKCCLSLC